MRVRGLKLRGVGDMCCGVPVAPHAGAWIETIQALTNRLYAQSHPMRVRGLKLIEKYLSYLTLLSHPMRVRGLKHGQHVVR